MKKFLWLWVFGWGAGVMVAGAQVTRHVWTNSPYPGAPFDAWTNAAHDIQAAVDAALPGDRVLVTDGVYTVTAQINVTNGVVIRSVNGPAVTVVAGGYPATSNRCFYLNAPGAEVSGFTITKGYVRTTTFQGYNGGAVLIMTNGVLTNCFITSSYSHGRGGGAALYRGGEVANCIFIGNSCYNGGAGLYVESNGVARFCTLAQNNYDRNGNGGGGAWIYMGGRITDSLAWGNSASNSSGGGFWLYNGAFAERCVARENNAYHGGGISVQSGSDLRSCLVYENRAANGGGGLYAHMSRVDACTVAFNQASGYGGGIYATWSNDVRNTICYQNASPDGNDWQDDDLVTYSHIRSFPALSAPGCTSADPQFRDAPGGNYRLVPGSPLVNAGTNQPWMDGAADLDAGARIVNGIVDFGAYELSPSAGPLLCGFTPQPASGLAPVAVEFTGHVVGSNQAALVYGWDFENDGSIDIGGPGLALVTNTYAALGYHSVRLVVSNAAGEVSTCIQSNCVKAGTATIYAAPGGAHVFPFGSWTDAATNLADAIGAGADGSLVLVSNGTYRLEAPLIVAHAMTMRSVNGRGAVVVDGQDQHRCFELLAAGALLDGLVLVKGAAAQGGGIYSLGATITNCSVYACSASNYAAGVYLAGGLLTDSDISSNVIQSAAGNSLWGAGVCAAQGAVIRRCRIATNTLYAANYGSIYGAGLYLDNATVEQSTIRGNYGYANGDNAEGGGIYAFNGSRIESSIVESNDLRALNQEASGGGISVYDGVITGTVMGANYLYAGYYGDGYGGGLMAVRSEITGGIIASNILYASRNAARGGGAYLLDSRMRNSAINGNASFTVEEDLYGGGVYLDAGGLLASCEVNNNNAKPDDDYSAYGAGVYCLNSTVAVCRITGNQDISPAGGSGGGGIFAQGAATIESCLLAGNFAVDGGGLSLQSDWAEAYNCTIVSNLAYAGGGVHGKAGLLVNSIIFNNATLDSDPNHWIESAALYYCNTTPILLGEGNRDIPPQFVNAAAGDYRLLPGSPGVDDGFNEDWMTNAVDLAGHARILNGTVDRGAYELDPASGPLACNPVASPAEGFYPLQVVFTGAVAGANTTGLYYTWDFNGDGSVDLEGYGLAVVTNLFSGYGSHNVALSVSNAAGSATTLQPGCVKVGPEIAYVATNGAHSFPFTNWTTAATNPHAAYAAAVSGTRIFIGEGTHPLASELYVDRAVLFEGQGAVTNVSVHGGNAARCFFLCHPEARVSALTISGGRADYGGGVYFARYGLVSNCVVAGNRSDNTGGGLYFDGGGEATECEIWGNATRSAESWGGGAYLLGGGRISRSQIHSHTNGGVRINGLGTLDSCQIYSNRASSGGGVWAYGGLVRNCLVIHNQASSQGGGLYLSTGLTDIESSTICHNSAGTSAGGMAHISGNCDVLNCVVRFNSAPTAPDYSGGAYQYTCAAPLPVGEGNTDRDPEFADAANDDYDLLPGSPCLNTGLNQLWMTNAADLAGSPRIIQAITDMGAFEYVPGALECNPSADPLIGLQPLPVTFTGYVTGANTNNLYFQWDFTGDGTWDRQGYGLGVVTQTYPSAGRYTVILAVSNAAGETSQRTRPSLITVAPLTAYAAPGGAHEYPFTNWAGAATDLVAAVAVAWHGSEVIVTDGVYAIRSALELPVAAALRSVNGPVVTIVDGQNATRCLLMNHAEALADGFTLMRGRAYQGGGVYFYNGTLSNCIIASCYATNRGGAIYLSQSGLVARCALMCSTGNQGGGVYMTGGAVCDTLIHENRATAVGGGVDIFGGRLQNCLVVSNYSSQNGGGVYSTGGEIYNCTIARNRSGGTYWGGGYYGYSPARIYNTIVYGNIGPATYSNYSGGIWTHSCAMPLPGGSNNIAADPWFVAPDEFNFRLATNSPCVDSGTVTNWPDADLVSLPRPLDGNNDGLARHDMGCYELLNELADSDADALTDTNELAIGTSPVRADSDGDWMNDGAEIRAGTDPLDPLSLFQVSGLKFQVSAPAVTWSSVNGKTYALSRSTNLPAGVWTPVQSGIPGLAPMNTVTDTTAAGSGPWHYRIELE